MSLSFLLLNGPNLNLLGEREPEHYGGETLADIENRLTEYARERGVELECFQSNSEGELIDAIHDARKKHAGILFNPGGYTHTSVALRDAVAAVKIPCVELHLSNVHAREEFRSRSLIAPVCAGSICGFGSDSYFLAFSALRRRLERG